MTFEILANNYHKTIRNLARFNKVNGYDEDDLSQEFLMILWRCYNNFDENKGVLFKTYFISSCKNKIAELRQKHRETTVPIDDHIDLIEDTAPDQFSAYRTEEVLKALLEVPRGDIVRMHYLYGITQDKIAKVEGVSQAYINKIISQAITLLRERLS